MNSNWSQMWKKLLLWASGYLSIIAFALVGGYVILKGDDALKKTAKKVFIVTLIFTAISMVLSVFSAIGGLFNGWYSSVAYDIYGILSAIRTVAQIVAYALGAILTIKNERAEQQAEEPKASAEQPTEE